MNVKWSRKGLLERMNKLEEVEESAGNAEGSVEARTRKFICYTFAPLGKFIPRCPS